MEGTLIFESIAYNIRIDGGGGSGGSGCDKHLDKDDVG